MAQTSADLAPRLPIESFSSEAATAAAQDSATKKQPSRSSLPLAEDDGDEATDSDSDEFKLGHNTDEEDESIEDEDEELLCVSNLSIKMLNTRRKERRWRKMSCVDWKRNWKH